MSAGVHAWLVVAVRWPHGDARWRVSHARRPCRLRCVTTCWGDRMTSLSVDVMTVISRVTYGEDQSAKDFLDALSPEDRTATAFGLAMVASGLLASLSGADERGVEASLAFLMDGATGPP